MSEIFRETGIEVFSASEIAGFKEGSSEILANNWFGGGGDSYDSLMLFSFTQKEKAEKALQLIAEFNKNEQTKYPVRGFILPVEQFGN
ncbi:MAG: hypothetical protein EOO01_38125 [Chitinophagaceae bacterium]|nr:MAG: hypothetical protein EOO01_38125 [Chitinophagaceae bacterium]